MPSGFKYKNNKIIIIGRKAICNKCLISRLVIIKFSFHILVNLVFSMRNACLIMEICIKNSKSIKCVKHLLMRRISAYVKNNNYL